MAAFEEKIRDVRRVMPFLQGKTRGRDTVVTRLFNLAQVVHFRPNDVTYRTLINSGDLELFSDFELRKRLEDHYASQALIRADYERQDHINEKYFGDFLIYRMDYDRMRKGDYGFMDDPLMRNIVQSLYGSYGLAIQSSRAGMERVQALKTELEEELGR